MQPVRNAFGQASGAPVPDWRPARSPSREPLVGRWCTLEPLDAARHAADLHAANAGEPDGRLWTYMAYGPFADENAYRAWVEANSGGEDPFFYAIVGRDDGRAIGVAAYLRIAPPAGTIEVGHIMLSPRLQRQTAATEAMFLMMANAFALGYRRYEWKCDSLNAPSRRAAQRLGFSYEGVFRQAVVVKGRNRDTAWFSVIDAEWPVLRDAYARWLEPSNFDAQGRQRLRLSALTAPVLKARG